MKQANAALPSENRHPARRAGDRLAHPTVLMPSPLASGSGGAPIFRRRSTDNETLLIIDDSPTVLTFLRKMFSSSGYEPLIAANAERGLEMIHSNKPDLVVLDVIMPGMTGPELATQLLRERADVRVLLMSGYPGDELPLPQGDGPVFPLLAKPFGGDALEQRLRELLAGA